MFVHLCTLATIGKSYAGPDRRRICRLLNRHIAQGDSRGTDRRVLATAEALIGGRGYTFSLCSSDDIFVFVDQLVRMFDTQPIKQT